MQGTNASADTPENTLSKKIGFFGLTMIAAGSCIGSGIFITPSDVAGQLGDPALILVVWTLGGVVALTGSLTLGELSGRFPNSGGVYVFIRECYGSLWAFLYGWCILTVVTSGAIAALSLTFSRYLSTFIPLSSTGQIIVGITAIVVVTLINVLGVKPGEIFSSLSTVLKLAGILAILSVGIFLGMRFDPGVSALANVGSVLPVEAFALAMIGVLWSYGGWHHASYVASESVHATRIVPRAMILGALIVTLTYVLMNWAYLRLLPVETLAGSRAVAVDAMQMVWPGGKLFVAGLITIATFGSIGIFTLTAPRIYYSMARDGIFFKHLAVLHPRHHTPVFAILLQSGWAIFLILLWATFENLITYVVFIDWVFMTLAACTIVYFRKKSGLPPKGQFRTPLYPVVPIVFIGISVWFVIYTLIGKPVQTIAGLILLCIGLPVYFLARKRRNKPSQDFMT